MRKAALINMFRASAAVGVLSAALVAAPAFAQSGQPALVGGQDEAAPAEDAQQDIVVTGSRIPQPNLTSTPRRLRSSPARI